MSSSLVIVAVPDENDRVWKVSSEKVPHLTLLYLGEDVEQVDNVDKIIEFVEHCANTMLSRFYLPVDRRGELGEDKADVLFFKKGRYDYKAIRDFRAALLQDANIKTAYDSTQQFDGPWQPHLTLGYPETPARSEADDQMGRFFDVQFNKVAVWIGDSEGPEFLLKDYWDEFDALEAVPMDVAMSDLQHFGVKGMRWGQRKTEEVSVGDKTKMVTPKKAAKLDKKWDKNIHSLPGAIAMHNAMAEHFNSRIGAVNDKYADKDFSKEDHDHPDKWSESYKQYNKEVSDLTVAGYTKAVKEVHGNSPTGKKRAEIEISPDGEDMRIVVKDNTAKHADAAVDVPDTLVFKITRNAKGLITSFDPVEDAIAQTADLGAEFLEHFGVKGMKWGVRRKADLGVEFLAHYGVKGMRWGHRNSEPPTAVAPTATSHVPRGARRKTKIQVEGGENHPAHEDAVKVARAQAKLKKSGPAALSNQELRELQDRINLERNVNQLVGSTTRVGRGRSFVKNLTGFNKEVNDTVGTGMQTHRLAKQFR